MAPDRRDQKVISFFQKIVFNFFSELSSYGPEVEWWDLGILQVRLNVISAVHDSFNPDENDHCVNVMYCRRVSSLVKWPDRESSRQSLQYAFRNSAFEKTICIIDCFEIYIEKLRNLLASAPSYSTYKLHHAMK